MVETLEPEGYLTDGKRLVEIVGVDVEGRVHLADVLGPVDGKPDLVLTDEVAKGWEQVPHGANAAH